MNDATTKPPNSIFSEAPKANNFQKRKPQRKRITDAKELEAEIKLSATRQQRLQKITEEKRKLWTALNDYIRAEGSFIVSPPYATPVRLEITNKDSALPALLARYGYNPHYAGRLPA